MILTIVKTAVTVVKTTKTIVKIVKTTLRMAARAFVSTARIAKLAVTRLQIAG